jgi:multicomponent K+:H+ antiporter subunit E
VRRILPHPVLSLGLVGVWLLLTRFSLGHLVLGSAVAVVAGWSFARVEPEAPRPHAIWPLVRLAGIVAVDILRSNFAVARLLAGSGAQRQSGFVQVHLRLQNRLALGMLAVIVTTTPGTAWLEYDERTGVLLLHVFDLKDPAEWQDLIANRYESLLMEAFG